MWSGKRLWSSGCRKEELFSFQPPLLFCIVPFMNKWQQRPRKVSGLSIPHSSSEVTMTRPLRFCLVNALSYDYIKVTLIYLDNKSLRRRLQWGLYQNKVTSSLAAIQRSGHWADNCKMVYCLTRYLLLVYTKTVGSVLDAHWLASQTPNILCYFVTSEQLEKKWRPDKEIIQINFLWCRLSLFYHILKQATSTWIVVNYLPSFFPPNIPYLENP